MYTDLEETKEAQESRIEYFRKKGNQQFTEEGRNAEITVDLVLQARAKFSDDKVNGPEDAIVNEMIKKMLMEKSKQLRGAVKYDSWPDGIPQFVEGRDIGLPEETERSPKERNQKQPSNSLDISSV